MKRRTRRAQVRAAAKRADKPSGKSRYARKKQQQARGNFSHRSPFVSVREAVVTTEEAAA